MKVNVFKVIKSCENCKNNVEYQLPHTCDECTSLDAPDWFMWEPNFKVMKKRNFNE